jgi:two-component system, chemotaxis family, sensor kinase CheA
MENNNNINENFNNIIDSETEEIISDFVSEAYHLLDKAVAIISKLDSENNTEAINIIFRLFHSIKGSASFLNFDNVRKVTHEAETFLDIFREQKTTPTYNEVDVLYQSFDLLEVLINSISEKQTDEGYEEYTNTIVKKLTRCIKERRHTTKKESPVKTSSEKDEVLDIDKYGFLGTFTESIDLHNIDSKDLQKYKDEMFRIIDFAKEVLPKLAKDPYNKDFLLDIIKCVYHIEKGSKIFDYTDINDISKEAEKLLNSIYNGNVTPTKDNINILDDILNAVKNNIDTIDSESDKKQPENINNKEELINKISETTKKTPTSGKFKPLGEILVEMGAIDDKTVEEALQIQHQKPDEVNKIGQLDIQKRLYGLRREDKIRVDTDKLDQLFDLVGELTIAEIMVTQNRNVIELESEDFTNATDNLAKITSDLQSLVMTIRMVPIENLFNRMVRLVNQLSREAGKKINFEVTGSETEIDRKLINELQDPLLHIIRNSVDHGIEEATERINKGKSPEGFMSLTAKHEGNEIWISIKDDGRGFDKKSILKKAIELGMVDEKKMKTLSDRKIWEFVFQPGFSTAKIVSEISGRGVGMDVVKKNIEKLRGNVEVKSEKDEGSEIILKIPLTLEIMNVMVIRIGHNLYSIPVIDVDENLAQEDVKVFTTQEEREVVRLREEIIPLIRLDDMFGVSSTSGNGEIDKEQQRNVSIILKKNRRKVCVFIDEILGTQQIVIKSLPRYMGQLKIVSGCSILGNGEISLIIDTNALIDSIIE